MWACFGVGAKGQQRILHSSYILPTQTTAWICVPDSHALWVVSVSLSHAGKSLKISLRWLYLYSLNPLLMGCLNGKVECACFMLDRIWMGFHLFENDDFSIIFKCQQLNTRNPGVVRVGQSLGFLTWSEFTNTHSTQTNNRKKWMP